MIRSLLSRRTEYETCEELLEEYLTTTETGEETIAIYDVGIQKGEKPVSELAESYRDEILGFTDGDISESDPEEVMSYLVRESDSKDTLYFLSHSANF